MSMNEKPNAGNGLIPEQHAFIGERSSVAIETTLPLLATT